MIAIFIAINKISYNRLLTIITMYLYSYYSLIIEYKVFARIQ